MSTAPPTRVAEHRPAPPEGSPRVIRNALNDSTGRSMAPEQRRPFESSLRADFSAVRVHDDGAAHGAAALAGARAFTYGSHVYLGVGESVTDRRLVGHELAHVLQQRDAAVVQRWSDQGPTYDELEAEADRASSRAVARERYDVSGRTAIRFQRSIGGWIKDKVRAVAQRIPGYDLLSVIIARDPITGTTVPRTATNVLKGVIGLLPGGHDLSERLSQSGALDRAGRWLSAEVDKLGFTWDYIKSVISRAWDALSWRDAVSPSVAWDRLKPIVSEPIVRLVNFVGAVTEQLVQLALEAAMSLAGASASTVMNVLRKAGKVIGTIARNPVGFVRNLVNALTGGLQRFASRIAVHLKNAAVDWITGALGKSGIVMPAKWDFRGVVSIVMQVLGLSYEAVRRRLERLLGPRAVRFFEQGLEFVTLLATKGITAVSERLRDFAGGLVDQVLTMVRNWIATSVVMAGIKKLATMFNPVGAFVQACIGIYDTVIWIVQKARQVMEFFASIVDSIDAIANGAIGRAVEAVERTMGRLLSLALTFLAQHLGLGNIGKLIRDVIAKIRTPIDTALDKLTAWIGSHVARLFGKQVTTGSWDGRLRSRQPLAFGNGERHELRLEVGDPTTLVMASTPTDVVYLFGKDETDPANMQLAQQIQGVWSDAQAEIKRIKSPQRRVEISTAASKAVGALILRSSLAKKHAPVVGGKNERQRLGSISIHRDNSKGNKLGTADERGGRTIGPSRALVSEHIVPVNVVSQMVTVIFGKRRGLDRSTSSDPSNAMHTVNIFNSAAERKTEGDRPFLKGKLEAKLDGMVGHRQTPRSYLAAFWEVADGRKRDTVRAVRDDAAERGAKSGKPVQPVPDEWTINAAFALQRADIEGLFLARHITADAEW